MWTKFGAIGFSTARQQVSKFSENSLWVVEQVFENLEVAAKNVKEFDTLDRTKWCQKWEERAGQKWVKSKEQKELDEKLNSCQPIAQVWVKLIFWNRKAIKTKKKKIWTEEKYYTFEKFYGPNYLQRFSELY